FEPTGHILLTFPKRIEQPKINILFPLDVNDTRIERYCFHTDSVKIYIPHTELDSIQVDLREAETILNTSLIRTHNNARFDCKVKPILNISNKVDRVRHIILTSESPLQNVDKSKIFIYEDSESRRNFQLQQDSTNKNRYHIRYNWRPKKD